MVNGQSARLGGRAFDVLIALAERHARVVTKSELLDLVWPGLVVEENNLSVHVMTLRKLLGNSSIVTVSGRGFRWTLAPSDEGDTPAATLPALAGDSLSAAMTCWRRQHRCWTPATGSSR